MVPVTTKPFLNSFAFIILQQGIPAFFLINQRKNQQTYYFLRNKNQE